VTEFDKVIPPGGVGKVTASLDTSHYKGPLAKSVRVTTSDPTQGTIMLTLKADVVSVIDVTPTDAPILQGKVGELTPVELAVSATDGQPFDVLRVEADSTLAASVRPAPGSPLSSATVRKKKPGKGAPLAAGASRYLVTLTPEKTVAVGQFVSIVTLVTNHPKAERIPLSATLLVAGPLVISPQLLFVRPSAKAPVRHVQIIKPEGGAPLKILGVESSDPDFTARATAVRKGREYDVTVDYTGKPGRGAVNSQITVKTNEPRQSAIVIPITGRL
jgi:hypothetical protein